MMMTIKFGDTLYHCMVNYFDVLCDTHVGKFVN